MRVFRTMKRRNKTLGLIGMMAALLLFAAAAVWLAATTAQAQTPTMKIVPAGQTVDISDGNLSIDIVIEGVGNLGAFEFKLVIDPAVVRLVGVTEGSFLGSTGRQVHCQAPTYYQSAPGMPADTLRFACATTGTGTPGPAGSGTLATVTLAPRKAGTSILNLIAWDDETGTTNTIGDTIEVTSSGGQVTVVGSGPEPTPEPDEPTPIPTSPPIAHVTPTPGSGPWWLTPEPGQAPMTRWLDGSTAGSTGGGSNSSSGETSGEGAQGRTGDSPRAGEGPPEEDAAWWPALAAGLLAISGTALIPLALYLQRVGRQGKIR